MSYAKLFSSITESSLWGAAHHVRILFVSMLAKADATGFVEAAMTGLARIANLSLEEAATAIAVLEGPDQDSKNPDNDGRRVAKVPGGWMVLNYEAYRNRPGDDERREYMRNYMKEYRRKHSVNNGKQSLATVSDGKRPSTQAEAEAEAAKTGGASRHAPPSLEAVKLQAAKIALPESEAVKFWNYWESAGWRRRSGPIKSWSHALTVWQSKWKDDNGNKNPKGNHSQDRESPRNIGTLNEGISGRYSNDNLRAAGKL